VPYSFFFIPYSDSCPASLSPDSFIQIPNPKSQTNPNDQNSNNRNKSKTEATTEQTEESS
jgi:hypothetical protein